ncbi:MAG: DUF4198 domain-containing protein [Rhodobacteraceae bacterium]|nr:DUF4198 domain-containing protein [Paracoccaceae bacterium]
MNIVTKLPAPILLATLIFTGAVSAHEYWIEPDAYRLESGANIVAEVMVGPDFNGDTYAYFPDNFNSFDVTDPIETRPIEGRIGDTPAIDIATLRDGLHVLSQFSSTSKLTWKTYQEFEEFVKLHGLNWVLDAHTERGLPDAGFSEAYTRFVKSLVAVGDGSGQDSYGGMFFELVAGANPYTDDISDGLPITVLFQGEPLPNTLIHVFYRAEPGAEAVKSAVFAGETAQTTIPNYGNGEYMVNAVYMVVPFPEDVERTGVVWHSLWASLTFQFGP